MALTWSPARLSGETASAGRKVKIIIDTVGRTIDVEIQWGNYDPQGNFLPVNPPRSTWVHIADEDFRALAFAKPESQKTFWANISDTLDAYLKQKV